MAPQQKINFIPTELSWEIQTKFRQAELLERYKPEDFLHQVYYQIAVQLANRILERLSPAIDKALNEMRLEETANHERDSS